MKRFPAGGASDPEADARFMALALEQAQQALQQGEVPVGAVVVFEGRVVGVGFNRPIAEHDPTAHAEMVALRAAAQVLQNYRLEACTLYVTLEPCAMCSGALLQSRLARVVYGAREPRTGAAGSVVDLFSVQALNNHTRVEGGVLAEECARLLRNFFVQRRKENRALHVPLREDALRTPEACFRDVPDYPWSGRHVHDLPALRGLRLHYLDEGPQDAAVVWLCLHDCPGWSYSFRHMMPIWLAAGHRVVVPDLIGFGRSDKPKKESVHTLAWHTQVLREWVELLNLQGVRLVLHGYGACLGWSLLGVDPLRYCGLLVMGPGPAVGMSSQAKWGHGEGMLSLDMPAPVQWPLAVRQAYDAPYPDRGYGAVLRVFPKILRCLAGQGDEAVLQNFHRFWSEVWRGCGMLVTARPTRLGEPWLSVLSDAPARGWQLVVSQVADRDLPEVQGAELARRALIDLV